MTQGDGREMDTEMDKYLLLVAKEYNWSMIGPGDWYLTSWKVFSDGSYRINAWFIPEENSDKWEKRKRVRRRYNGKMNQEQFDNLLDLLSIDNWGNPERCIDACDGTAWEIEQYSPNGTVIESSGRIGYIYGDGTLENIVSCLPKEMTDMIY